MARLSSEVLSHPQSLAGSWTREVLLVIGASLLVAVCAHLAVPLPFTPVPLTLGNFAVLLVGMALGPRRGFAALALYLAEGAAGLPFFTPTGPGGLAQLMGPTGGYLLAYPLAALLAGWIAERRMPAALGLPLAGIGGEVVIFTGGVCGLMVLTHQPLAQAMALGVAPFAIPELIKIAAAAAMLAGMRRAGLARLTHSNATQ